MLEIAIRDFLAWKMREVMYSTAENPQKKAKTIVQTKGTTSIGSCAAVNISISCFMVMRTEKIMRRWKDCPLLHFVFACFFLLL